LNPLVSIIIPTYNRAHLIGETLDSVLAQTYIKWECIIVDDGSTDDTAEVLKRYLQKDSRFQYHHRPHDRLKGANACRNHGFELSKGEYINWFDDDDLMHPNKLFMQVNELKKNKLNFTVCQTMVFQNNLKNLIGHRSVNIFSDNNFYDYLTQKIVWMTGSAVWKKEFLNTLNYLFDEDLQAAQEWEFHCRVLSFCENYSVINKSLVYIRKHDESITYNGNENDRMWNYFLARNKLYSNNKIKLTMEVSEFLQNYLLRNFKKYVRSFRLKKSIKIFRLYVMSEKKFSLKVKFYAFFAIISYFTINRGHVFLKNVRY